MSYHSVMKTKPVCKNCIHRSHGRSALLLVPLMLVSFALSPTARAVCQEGCLTSNNTVLGEGALLNNTGVFNTAVGFGALFSNTTGNYNTATGIAALSGYLPSTGNHNTAIGFYALLNNTTGNYNTASGSEALLFNYSGVNNTASGFQALENNTTGNG